MRSSEDIPPNEIERLTHIGPGRGHRRDRADEGRHRGGAARGDPRDTIGRVPPRVPLLVLIAALLLHAAPVAAQGTPRIREAERQRLERLGNEVARATREYRTSLERMRDIHQKDAESLAELVEVRRDLYQRQIISRREVEIAEGLLAEAQAKIKEAERWILDADKMIAEATVHSELARMTLAAGGYVATGVFIRFNGTVAFTPADLPRVERFFGGRFGRSLPVSALGQSPRTIGSASTIAMRST